MTINRVRLGALQLTGIQIYVLDDAHDPVPGLSLAGNVLSVADREAAIEAVLDASDSAYDDGDQAVVDAMLSLWSRLAKMRKM